MKVLVDSALCVGHGRCYVLGPEVPRELEDQARLGEANCPENAIRLETQ